MWGSERLQPFPIIIIVIKLLLNCDTKISDWIDVVSFGLWNLNFNLLKIS